MKRRAKDLAAMLDAHMAQQAATALRAARGDRKLAEVHLKLMAGQDALLSAAIRSAGFRAALKAAQDGRQASAPAIDDGEPPKLTKAQEAILTRCGQRFRVHHPD